MFNPTGFVMDEAGGNWKALQIIYGDNALERAVSCEFHYKQSVGRRSCKLPDDKKTKSKKTRGNSCQVGSSGGRHGKPTSSELLRE